MQHQKLILFDFDGVIIDGMHEYWHSSLIACKKFLSSNEIPIDLNINEEISETFINIRPWVKYGWEMVLITHEIVKREHPLKEDNKYDFINQYYENCQRILHRNSWNSEVLQKSLNKSREYQIANDFEQWVRLHNPFSEVLSFIKYAQREGYHIGIITTKGLIFASKLLNKLNIYPELIFGYESGTKVEIASKLLKEYDIIGFIEDRRNTLITIKNNRVTKNIRCYLADWGYLKNSDRIDLPHKIELLRLRNLGDILAI